MHTALVEADADLADPTTKSLDLLQHRAVRIAVRTTEQCHGTAIDLPAECAIAFRDCENLARRFGDERRMKIGLGLRVYWGLKNR